MKYLLLLLLLPVNVFAVELIIEQGRATTWFADTDQYTSAGYGAVALRSNGPRFTEIIQGGWQGVNNSRFVGLSFGGRSQGKYFAEYTLGGAFLLKPETAQLDGNEQIMLSVGIGGRFDNLFATVRLRHFSNANTKGDNHGFEVIVGSLGVIF